MPRPRNPNPRIRLVIMVDPDLYARAALMLFSEVHGRVPLGQWSELFNGLLRKALSQVSPTQEENP